MILRPKLARQILVPFIISAGMVFVSACDTFSPDRSCTLIGCSSGVTVVVENRPSVAYRVEVYSGSSTGPKYTFQCDNPNSCGDPFFTDFTPDHLFVDVVVGSSRTTYEVVPKYTESRPN